MEILYMFGVLMAFLMPITLMTVIIIWAMNKWG